VYNLKGVLIMAISLYDIRNIATKVRNEIIEKYGHSMNHCLEASDRIVEELAKLGAEAKVIEGWVEYDSWGCCTDYSYAEHSWVELDGLTIDVTGDQFDSVMYHPFPKVCIGYGLPRGWCKEEPENLIDDPDYWPNCCKPD